MHLPMDKVADIFAGDILKYISINEKKYLHSNLTEVCS